MLLAQFQKLYTCSTPCFRYRNFRTFTSPRPVQFASLAVEPSGEIVCAGGRDTFEIYVWSMQTGRLLEVKESSKLFDTDLNYSLCS